MNEAQARQILGVGPLADERMIKESYRQLIRIHHPDVLGAEASEQRRRAQEINEAYRVLKLGNWKRDIQKHGKVLWNAPLNPAAFCERTIYIPYSMDLDVGQLRQAVAAGCYMWDPEEEAFEDFLKSILQVLKSLMEKIEDELPVSEAELEAARSVYQARLFYVLAMQYLSPAECIKKIAVPMYEEKERKVYRFWALLGEKQNTDVFPLLEGLKEGDRLYPLRLQGQRIIVGNEKRQQLGYLSLEDDAAYFCIVPLLREKKAQIKLTVRSVERKGNYRLKSVRCRIELLLRLSGEECADHTAEYNEKVKEILKEYRERLQRAEDFNGF